MPDTLDGRVLAWWIVKERPLVFAIVMLLWGILVAYNVSALGEAFGSGPPYYGRSTNMDKWQDPRPAVASIDIFAVLTTVVVVTRIRCARHQRGY